MNAYIIFGTKNTLTIAKVRHQKKLVELTCPICGMKFVQTFEHRTFCSDRCRIEAKKRRNPDYYAKDMTTNEPLDSAKQNAPEDKYIPPEKRKCDSLDTKLRGITASGKSYAEYQTEQTLSRIPKVVLPEWAIDIQVDREVDRKRKEKVK